MSFDDSKPYGYVRGLPGVKHEQNGNLYGPQGDLVGMDGKPLGKPKKPEAKAKPKAKPEPKKPEAGGVRPMSEQAEDDA